MSDADAFDALVAEFYPVWFRYHPERALGIGVGGYEQLLPAQDDDDVGALAAWLESLIVALEELDFAALDLGRRLDLRLMFNEAQAEYEALLERDWRLHDPLRFLPSAEILHLACPAPDGAWDDLAALVGSVPEYLRHAQGQLLPLGELLAPALVGATVTAARDGAVYLRELAASDPIRFRPRGGQMTVLCLEASEALAGFAALLEREVVPVARGSLGCGQRQWRFLLRKRHSLCLDEGSLRRFLAAEVAQTRADLEVVARSLGVEASGQGVRDLLGREPPLTGETRRQAYREVCARQREALALAASVPLVEAPLGVRDAPLCPRPRGWGGGYRADQANVRGVLTLEPAPEGEGLSQIRERCLEQGWAGAHLIAFAGGPAGRRLPRRLSASDSLARGWGLYLRDLLQSRGGLAASERFLGLWYRWRGLRLAELDLKLHLEGVAQREILSELAVLAPEADQREALLVDLARNPTDWVAGAVGWRILQRARTCYLDQGGEGLEAFHQRLFGEGALPLPLLIEHLFGPDLWCGVLEGLLD